MIGQNRQCSEAAQRGERLNICRHLPEAELDGSKLWEDG
jgi:hypothetical protein